MLSAKALDEFLAADIVVIGAPMYNFGVPSQLKAWIDCLAVAGKTFRYTETGVEGLAGGKRVIIASSRGGFYAGSSPMASLDHQEAYLTGFFGFIGVADIAFVRAEGVNVSPEQRQRGIELGTGRGRGPRGCVKNGTWSDRLGVLKANTGQAEVTTGGASAGAPAVLQHLPKT